MNYSQQLTKYKSRYSLGLVVSVTSKSYLTFPCQTEMKMPKIGIFFSVFTVYWAGSQIVKFECLGTIDGSNGTRIIFTIKLSWWLSGRESAC